MRPIWTWRFVLVTVPSFSGHAEAGNTTSANIAVSVMKMSCTTRVIEVGEACAGMADVRVRHRRVLTHDVETLDIAVIGFVGDLDHGQTTFRIEFRAPEFFEFLLGFGIVDRLVVGVDDGDKARVRGALDVVLPA